MIRAPEAAPELSSQLDFTGDFEGGTELTLLTDVFVRLGRKEGPEPSEARESTLLAAFIDTVEISRGQIKQADLADPALDKGLATQDV